ncbi:5-formyltetrahydrofolate cyclo-ligase [Sphingomonas radiodurans]|uniref:5-formyltetrahydrofolate cyclo-ligase n=1 Tax=Sphingomonas radiodurans TaxID=2890321 RepID=UPI001E4B3C16|nr:5-formyltetrahydrofolate cyclo-ligase [Sphingomonas radiodurans]WBH16429.1 5-formyltetrahydrofolate cyclo-ligase [Sphingomonas radiodurans]
MDKRTLRAAARAARDALGASLPTLEVPDPLRALMSPGMIVASYVPLGSEADPAPLMAAAEAAGCTIALPHVVDRATPLRFLAWQRETALVIGPLGLHQPPDDSAEVMPDLVLTPLVAFDRVLGRIGQGAGYYDRAFARLPNAHRIGVAFSVQEVAHVPADPWDVPLHAIITEQEWITS